jgi:hypothetical protein
MTFFPCDRGNDLRHARVDREYLSRRGLDDGYWWKA